VQESSEGKGQKRHETVYVKILREFKTYITKEFNKATGFIRTARFKPLDFFESCLIKFVLIDPLLKRLYEIDGQKDVREEGSLLYTLASLMYSGNLIKLT